MGARLIGVVEDTQVARIANKASDGSRSDFVPGNVDNSFLFCTEQDVAFSADVVDWKNVWKPGCWNLMRPLTLTLFETGQRRRV